MGYTTDFDGSFKLDKPLTPLHKLYLEHFNDIRHMKRNVEVLPVDPILKFVKLPKGVEGEFYIGSKLKKMPSWTPQTNKYYTEEFRQKVLVLMYVQKYQMPELDQNVFFMIIKHLSKDISNLDFNHERNLEYLSIKPESDHKDKSILDNNRPSKTQPGLWCQWTPNKDGTAIEWDGGEKFYEYTAWLQYIIDKFLIPWGYELNGEVTYQGEGFGDSGTIRVVGNVVTVIEHINEDDEDLEYDEDDYEDDEDYATADIVF